MSRPRIKPDCRLVDVALTLTPKTLEDSKEAAAAQGVSLSSVVECLLVDWLILLGRTKTP
jgi:hypothetical protein